MFTIRRGSVLRPMYYLCIFVVMCKSWRQASLRFTYSNVRDSEVDG